MPNSGRIIVHDDTAAVMDWDKLRIFTPPLKPVLSLTPATGCT